MMSFCSACVFVLFCLFSLMSFPSKIKNWHHLNSSPSFLWKLYWFLKTKSLGNVPKNPSSHSYTQAHLGKETQKPAAAGVDGPVAHVPGACTLGPKGLALGGSSQLVLCLLLPPPHPHRHPQRIKNSLFQQPRKVRPSTQCSRGQQGRVPGSGSELCVHTCSKAQQPSRSRPGTATLSPANSGGGQG